MLRLDTEVANKQDLASLIQHVHTVNSQTRLVKYQTNKQTNKRTNKMTDMQ